MSDLNELEQLQANLAIVKKNGGDTLIATQYFEDLLFKIVDFAKNRMLEGEGSPEGVVTAPKRSMYFDTSAGFGDPLYYKTTDTGNTGWVKI